jgi:hypothetical protein
MRCLSDVEIQAVADGEAADDTRQHAASCPRCSERVKARETLTAGIEQAINIPLDVPAGVSRRIARALEEGSAQGATRLRENGVHVRPWRRAAWSTAAVAIATTIAVFFVAPLFKGPATVSAAEILARSANRLATQVTSGVEMLDYALTLDGVPREMMPDHTDGVYRVRQVIDHNVPGRYLVATYDPAGELVSSVAQNPASHQRVVTVRIEDQAYRFEFTIPESVALSLPEMERLHMQASVTMMQASGNQSLHVIDGPSGRQYRIEVPHVSAETSNAVWDLAEAQVVIDATDYHVVEFAVKGTFLKQPYSMSYQLINRVVADRVTDEELDVPHDPAAITIRGEGTAIPARDTLVAALRELTRVKQGR